MNIPQELRDNPGRVADRHVAFRFEWQLQGGHVHIRVRAASRIPSAQVNHSRGLCGELTMTPDEWEVFRLALLSVETPGPTWFDNGRSLSLLAGAGHPDLTDVETDHAEHQFIEIVEVSA